MKPLASARRRSRLASASRRSRALRALVICATLLLSTSRVPAQPAQHVESTDQLIAAWDALRAENAYTEVHDPARAIENYRAFYEKRAYVSTGLSVQIASLIAQIYLHDLHEHDTAIKVYNWAIKLYGDYPEGRRLKTERELVVHPPAGTASVVIAPPASSVQPGQLSGPSVPATGALMQPVVIRQQPAAIREIGSLTIASSTTTVPVLLARLRGGTGTAEEAWQKGQLSIDDAIFALGESSVQGGENAVVRLALAGVLANHGGDWVKAPVKLAAPVRLALADYYASVKDGQAVPLYEALLGEISGPPKDGAVAPAPLTGLANFYEAAGDFRRSAETLLRTDQYTTTEQQVSDAVLGAARLYRDAGDETKAKELYAKVPQYGNGWMTGLALYDQAERLIQQGKHAEARKLLLQPVHGDNAEQIEVGMLTLLGYSYYRTGEFEAARKYSQQAVAQYKSLKNPLPGEGSEAQVNRAEGLLSWIELWAKEPIVCTPRKLRLTAPSQAETLRCGVIVRCFRDLPLRVTINNVGVKEHLEEKEKWRRGEYHVEKQLWLEIAPAALKHNLEATLSISSPNFPEFSVKVPIHVEVQTAAP